MKWYLKNNVSGRYLVVMSKGNFLWTFKIFFMVILVIH